MDKSNYEVHTLTSNDYKIFTGVYTDFRNAAKTDYMFEIEPLEYQDFLSAIEKNYIKCIALFENKIPTAFLVYTTAISESIELNLIHCLGDEDIINKRKILLEEFLKLTKDERKDKVVCYPMLGSQSSFTADISHYGFKFIGLAVLRFLMNNGHSKKILQTASYPELDERYKLESWNNMYFEDVIKLINKSFKTSSDALFDTRYLSIEGTKDIITKITKGIYGEFLPHATTLLLDKGDLCGICIANMTGEQIANFPLVAIDKAHKGKGLAKYILRNSVGILFEDSQIGNRPLSEINVSAETNNIPALKMYRNIGFKEDYSYPQSYLPLSK